MRRAPCPSIATIANVLRVPRETAVKVRALMDGTTDPDTYASVQRWSRQCLHEPRTMEKTLCALNEVLGTHGVEPLLGLPWGSHYHQDVQACYCNAGDPYAATVIRDHVRGRWVVGCWGSFVESNPKRFPPEG
jgi:hypothetical protein